MTNKIAKLSSRTKREIFPNCTTTSFSTSVTALDIFRALLNAATLSVYDINKDGIDHLADWLIQQEITIYRSIATAFRQLAKSLTETHKFPWLRLIAVGGERIYKADPDTGSIFPKPFYVSEWG